MRLFTGLDLPAEVVRNLEELLDVLRRTACIQWSPPANLHITTKFIGEWPEARLEELKAALAGIPPRPVIAVHIRKLGFFPNPHSPRVFWCGVDAPGLDALAADTDRATAALGIEIEKRAFSPHLTLARIKDKLDLQPLREAIAALSQSTPSPGPAAASPQAPRGAIPALPALDFGRFDAAGYFLYRSAVSPKGSVYTKLAEFPFSK